MNYESRFVELKAPSYAKGETCSDAPKKARLISVASAISHTSESRVDGWRNEITNLADTFSHSPLAKRFGMSLDVDEFVKKLKGMHTDHANDQKKTYRIWQEWKRRVICSSYGFKRVEKMKDDSPNELSILLLSEMSQVIDRVGGGEKWDTMDAAARQPLLTEMMEHISQTLGAEVLESLPPEERRSVELFFWAGCSMHKELNSVKGGNTAMMNWWAENGVSAPILLANKDNDATIQLTEIVNASALAVQRALESSSRGGVKAANLAGAIFNHKDDKKGQQDIHRLFFMQHKGGAMKKFPDTHISLVLSTRGRGMTSSPYKQFRRCMNLCSCHI